MIFKNDTTKNDDSSRLGLTLIRYVTMGFPINQGKKTSMYETIIQSMKQKIGGGTKNIEIRLPQLSLSQLRQHTNKDHKCRYICKTMEVKHNVLKNIDEK